MTVRQRSNHGESIALGGNDGAAFEHTAQAFDMSGRPIREIAQRALSHLAVLAVTLAQQDGGRRVPVRHGFNIHGATSAQATREYKRQNLDYMATLWMRLRSNQIGRASCRERGEISVGDVGLDMRRVLREALRVTGRERCAALSGTVGECE